MQLSFYSIALLLGILFATLYLLLGFHPKEYRKINFLVLFILFTELLSVFIWTKSEANLVQDSYLFNLLYVYIRPTAMLLLFSQLPFSCQLQKTVLPAISGFLIIGLLNSLYLQPINESLQSYTYLLGHGLVLSYSVIFFKDILKQSKFRDVNLLSLPYFWMASLILFSYGERYIFFILTYYYPSIGNYGVGHVFLWVQFLAGIMYLSLGLSFFAPRFFNRYYT
ncbi:hypothetical protein [Cyclobacterium amurskyense]|jgi:hypothetical protein|uniref:Integral membrane protein n=1 Tax=Cyclobacterium amurskyense TaxID=320787 RepID=A0A0H4PRF0_9BACT|nr:hypothetical protein [Cyclobacterium amurskyense]AKP50857.1 hypothetical protein CA2015_1417 [Cyclobacterium amurskyense]|tara:strand:+ start:139 stop:810 length:672 start_codon:yes stop_codon:yes gene_type:complete